MNHTRSNPSRHRMTSSEPDRAWPWYITHVALILAISIVVARMTTVDALRDPWEPSPGSPISHGPGPTTSLIFDLLAMLPALLVLLRRSVDADYRLINRWSHLPLLALGIWAVLSTAWSADRFAAAISASHLLAFACLLWAMSQLVRSWDCFRLVAAVAFGLLLVLVVQSLIYKFVDAPQTLELWNRTKPEILKAHQWTENSFAARQFEHKLVSAEMVGFFNSANSFAAISVLLFAACVGIGIQKRIDGDDPQWLALPIVAAISCAWILISARSKTSIATPIVGVVILFCFTVLRDTLRKHSVAAYVGGAVIVAIGLAAVVGHGLYHHGLFAGHFSNSLDFRWKYWVASAGMFAEHPVIGTGWENFGLHYLAHRLPEASEEIKDPHNFLVRFFVELGAVGGLLAISWLLRLAWELTRPGTSALTESGPESDSTSLTVLSPVLISILGIGLGTIASTDFSQQFLDTLALLMKPMLFFLTMVLGTIGASMISPQSWKLDARPGPWIYCCMVIGLGLFLLHNLIDFSWFEPGAMAVFMMLIGSALGMAAVPPGRAHSRIWPTICAITVGLGLLAAVLFFVVPIGLAEQAAHDADDTISAAPTDRSRESAAAFAAAGRQLGNAASIVPYNAEYLLRKAKALWSSGQAAAAQSAIAQAKAINPLYIDAYYLDANLQLNTTAPDESRVRSDFETILRLNPNDASMHQQYGETLDRFGLRGEARDQYQLAIKCNAALPQGEPRRLSIEQLTDLQKRIRRDE